MPTNTGTGGALWDWLSHGSAASAFRSMLKLNDSEARTFQQILNGERLWSWPNGRIQLGQTFPDITVINRLMREGFLDEKYRPTTWGRSALLAWFQARSLPSSAERPQVVGRYFSSRKPSRIK